MFSVGAEMCCAAKKVASILGFNNYRCVAVHIMYTVGWTTHTGGT